MLAFSKHENVEYLKKKRYFPHWRMRTKERDLSCLSISDPGQKYEFLFA